MITYLRWNRLYMSESDGMRKDGKKQEDIIKNKWIANNKKQSIL